MIIMVDFLKIIDITEGYAAARYSVRRAVPAVQRLERVCVLYRPFLLAAVNVAV